MKRCPRGFILNKFNITVFVFILALEILFILINSKPEIEGMTIFHS